ncbi:MAG: FtsX-like permease family protein [SAR202 cluster bacterium]|nr:FtsX-like permease family protein [SAR202 cluster bacterium]
MEQLFGIPTLWLALGLALVLLVLLGVVAYFANRHRFLFKLGVRNVPRRKAQSVLIVMGLMLSTTIIASSLGIGDTVTHSIRVDAFTALGHTDEIISSPEAVLFGGAFLPEGALDQIQSVVSANDQIDGIMPQTDSQFIAILPRTARAEAEMRVIGFDPNLQKPFGELITAQPEWDGLSKPGNVVEIDDLSRVLTTERARNEMFLNQDAARELKAKKGDRIILVTPTDSWQMRVHSIVKNGGLAGGGGNSPVAIVRLDLAQAMLGVEGKFTKVLVSNRGGVEGGIRESADVTRDLRLAFSNRDVAQQIFEILGGARSLALLDFSKESSVSPGLRDDISLLKLELGRDAMSDDFISIVADQQFVATLVTVLNRGGLEENSERLNTLSSQLFNLTVDDIKADRLELAEQTGSQFVSLFTIFGSVSIIVGLLLIFLVFVLLAAARSSEIGIGRAIGLRQSHVVQAFLYEGLAYALAAAVLGTILGVIASIALSAILQSVVSAEQFTIHSKFTTNSAIIAFSAGMVLTIVTVFLSSLWVSRLNIIVAIRGLRVDPNRDVSTPVRILRQGWPVVVVGVALAVGNLVLNSAVDLGVALSMFYISISVIVIGVGMCIRWVLGTTGMEYSRTSRIGGSFQGLVLLLLWSLPLDTFESITGELSTGAEIFVLSGTAMVGSAVWLIMNNTGVIVWILYAVPGRIHRLKAVMKTAIAYPMAARFLTGLTVVMFAIIIFNLTIFAIINNLGNLAREDPSRVTGGYDISAIVRPEIPIYDFKRTLNDEAEGFQNDIQVNSADWVRRRVHDASASVTIPVEARQVAGLDIEFKALDLTAVDDTFMKTSAWRVSHFDPTYETGSGNIDRDMWLALQRDPSLAIINNTALERDDSFAPNDPFNPNFGGFTAEGLKASSPREIAPFEIEMRPVGGDERIVRRRVIAVLESLADQLSTERRTRAEALTQARPATLFTSATVLMEISDVEVPFTNWHIRRSGKQELGVTDEDVAARMETAFMDRSMVAVSTALEFALTLSEDDAFNRLFQGFMGIGLIVGVASIGVLSFRAVEQRRQSIGMLRAIGFRSRHVVIQFLLEASIITLIGTILGLTLGAITSWNIFNELAKETDGLRYDIPWLNVIVIVGIAWFFSVLMTVLPARQAGTIYPAEALRYE